MLELSSISMRFGGLHVLHDVNLRVPEGAIFGLIGPNGAGKTTVFNIITGLLRPSGGNVMFDGRSLVGMRPHLITRAGVARTFQNIRLFKEMTLLENVVVGAYRHMDYGVPGLLFSLPGFRRHEARARERALELLSWMRLDHKANELDEPVAGMNTGERAELMREIEAIRRRGYTILMIEHDMRFVMGLCETIAVLNFGKIIACGGPEAIRTNEQVIEAYLGRDDEEEAFAEVHP
jgi:branched-chain amino acid transport system ATP-binding protein